MAEWSNAPVLKTGVLQGTGGSNPSLSATESCKSKDLQDFFGSMLDISIVYESGKTKCARFEKRNVQKSGKTKRAKKFAHTTL